MSQEEDKNRTTKERRYYTKAFRIKAVRMGEKLGVSEAARKLDIPYQTLYNWCRDARFVSRMVEEVDVDEIAHNTGLSVDEIKGYAGSDISDICAKLDSVTKLLSSLNDEVLAIRRSLANTE